MRTRHSAFWRYTAFQVPGWILAAVAGWWLHRSLGAPLWISAGLPAAWVIKDYAMYPALRFAYEADRRKRIEHLIGAVGTAVEPLAPTGYVRVRGELWRATAGGGRQIDPHAAVEVVGGRGLTLSVRRGVPPRAAKDSAAARP